MKSVTTQSINNRYQAKSEALAPLKTISAMPIQTSPAAINLVTFTMLRLPGNTLLRRYQNLGKCKFFPFSGGSELLGQPWQFYFVIDVVRHRCQVFQVIVWNQ